MEQNGPDPFDALVDSQFLHAEQASEEDIEILESLGMGVVFDVLGSVYQSFEYETEYGSVYFSNEINEDDQEASRCGIVIETSITGEQIFEVSYRPDDTVATFEHRMEYADDIIQILDTMAQDPNLTQDEQRLLKHLVFVCKVIVAEDQQASELQPPQDGIPTAHLVRASVAERSRVSKRVRSRYVAPSGDWALFVATHELIGDVGQLTQQDQDFDDDKLLIRYTDKTAGTAHTYTSTINDNQQLVICDSSDLTLDARIETDFDEEMQVAQSLLGLHALSKANVTLLTDRLMDISTRPLGL
jgi:hypothetical protein